jgi:hypothetical protein
VALHRLQWALEAKPVGRSSGSKMEMTPVEEGSFLRGSLSGPTTVWLSLERWPLFWTCIDPIRRPVAL